MAGASALLLLACEGKAKADLSAAFSARDLRNKTAANDEEGQAAADGKGLALRLWIFRGRIDEVSSISGLGSASGIFMGQRSMLLTPVLAN